VVRYDGDFTTDGGGDLAGVLSDFKELQVEPEDGKKREELVADEPVVVPV
jgi:hypothetical protein